MTDTVALRLRPFDDVEWEAEVDFLFDEGIAFAVLGLEGFLDRWAVSFNGYHGYFVVEPAQEFHDSQDPNLLTDFQERWPGV